MMGIGRRLNFDIRRGVLENWSSDTHGYLYNGIHIFYSALALHVLLKMQSPTCSASFIVRLLDMHGCQGQNLRPLLLPQLRRHNTADSRPNGLAGLVDQHAGVVVKLDHAAVRSLPLLRCAHDDCVADVSSSYFVCCADGHAVARLRAEVALLLDDYDDAVAWMR